MGAISKSVGVTAFLTCAIVLVEVASAQSTNTARGQADYANQGKPQADHTFDGSKAPPRPVKANPAAKPSPVGQPVTTQGSNKGYKPPPPPLKTTPPPPPPVPAKSK
jgi:hypothetical protein